jgi:hypothetical protein
MTIAVTGSRKLTGREAEQALWDLDNLVCCHRWLMGDASGLDALAWRVAQKNSVVIDLYQVHNQLPIRARYAERSTRMVKALAANGGILHAWPNKACPPDLCPSRRWPKSANGCGTWGTIGLAVGLGVPVVLHPLVDFAWPSWLQVEQLALI